MKTHFSMIYKQRDEFITKINDKNVWARPREDKWSIGETYYHLYLMVKRFKQLNKFYIPCSSLFARLFKHKQYKTMSKDIYSEYHAKNNRPMKAPSILLPPKK